MDLEGSPSLLQFHMPAEWEPHSQCWMGWPVSSLHRSIAFLLIVSVCSSLGLCFFRASVFDFAAVLFVLTCM